ncbi:PREDICTED: uncharacterized protein LOC106750590 isoform X2 [Dinoponera quadriceps]|nr:PREDICTED: uncharacterized protein LOC106750590 isoform X2 [Dinoponera quadriceps]
MMQLVLDIVNRSGRKRYEALKLRIITLFEEMNQLREQLRGYKLRRDEKPSLVLQRLTNLAAGKCTDAVLRTLFLEVLPLYVRDILVISEVKDLDKLALQADKILEIDNGANKEDRGENTNYSKFWEAIEAVAKPMSDLNTNFEDSTANSREEQKAKMNLFIKHITDVFDLAATESMYTVSDGMIQALQKFVDPKQSEEIWGRRVSWSFEPNYYFHPYPVYGKILFLLTGDSRYKSENIKRWPIPPTGKRNVFQELYIQETRQRLFCDASCRTFDRLSIWEKLYEDFSTGKIKLKGISLKYAEASSLVETSPSQDEEEIKAEEEATKYSESESIHISFPFLESTINSDALFCTILSQDILYYIMHIKCVGEEVRKVNNMSFRDAWCYADKYYFYPWILKKIKNYEREKLAQPTHLKIATEVVDKIQANLQQGPDKKIEAKNLSQFFKLLELLSLKVSILQSKLQSLEKARSATSPVSSTCSSPIATTQGQDENTSIEVCE